MNATTMVHVRVDDAIKEQAASALDRMGLTTRAAMQEARAFARFETAAELMDALSSDKG